MQSESACHRLCDDIADLLLALPSQSAHAAFLAGRATRALSAALHRASGIPEDPLWYDALESVDRFVEHCAGSRRLEGSFALRDLSGFVEENADVLSFGFQMKRAG